MKVICSMVMSLDGFIADSNGKTVSGPPDWAVFEENAKTYRNFVIGRGTNKTGALNTIDCENRIIVSSQSYDNPAFTRATSPENVLELLEGKTDTVYLVGGGKLNASFAKAGLIDELILTTVPKVVGSGIKLFGDEDAVLELQLKGREELEGGRVRLTYQVKN